MNREGVSVIQIAVAISVAGIIALMVTPVVDHTVARARRAEATFNLKHIANLQKTHFEQENKFASFPQIGYTGNGNHSCNNLTNALGFTLAKEECESLRYNYKTEPVGTDIFYYNNYSAIAHAPSDHQDYYVYPGCEGAGSSNTNKNYGDMLAVWHMSDPQVCRNIISFCPAPLSNAAVDGCATLANLVPANPLVGVSPQVPSSPPPACTTCSCCCGSLGSGSTTWLPDPSTVCSGVSFTQTGTYKRHRSCNCPANLNCPTTWTNPNTTTRQNVGTKICCNNSCSAGCGNWSSGTWSQWSPSRSTQCSGTTFTQSRTQTKTRTCSNLCAGTSCNTTWTSAPQTRNTTGTNPCPTPIPPCSCSSACGNWKYNASSCGSWGSCSNGLQYRTCPTYRTCSGCSKCPITSSYTFSRACATPTPTPTSTPTTINCSTSTQCCDGNTVKTQPANLSCSSWKGTWNNYAANKGCCTPTTVNCSTSTQCCDGNTVKTQPANLSCSSWKGTWNNYAANKGCCTPTTGDDCSTSTQCCDGSTVKQQPANLSCSSWKGTWNNYATNKGCCTPTTVNCSTSTQCCDGNTVKTQPANLSCSSWKGTWNNYATNKGCCTPTTGDDCSTSTQCCDGSTVKQQPANLSCSSWKGTWNNYAANKGCCTTITNMLH